MGLVTGKFTSTPPFPLSRPYLERQKHQGESFQLQHEGKLPDNTFWNYLRWRRSLNERRFDHYHPRIAPMLSKDLLARIVRPPVPERPVVSLPPLEHPIPPIAIVPEPSSFVGLAAIAVFVLTRKRNGKKV